MSSHAPQPGRVLKDTELADVFGIEMAEITEPLKKKAAKKKAARTIRQKPTTKPAKKKAARARKPGGRV